MKQIPYGITDFSRIQKENYYYVDKTMFIKKIEMQPPYLFLIRPRRFGKSLTLAMLEAYYDEAKTTWLKAYELTELIGDDRNQDEWTKV